MVIEIIEGFEHDVKVSGNVEIEIPKLHEMVGE
jgi:hypothetical protein